MFCIYLLQFPLRVSWYYGALRCLFFFFQASLVLELGCLFTLHVRTLVPVRIERPAMMECAR